MIYLVLLVCMFAYASADEIGLSTDFRDAASFRSRVCILGQAGGLVIADTTSLHFKEFRTRGVPVLKLGLSKSGFVYADTSHKVWLIDENLQTTLLSEIDPSISVQCFSKGNTDDVFFGTKDGRIFQIENGVAAQVDSTQPFDKLEVVNGELIGTDEPAMYRRVAPNQWSLITNRVHFAQVSADTSVVIVRTDDDKYVVRLYDALWNVVDTLIVENRTNVAAVAGHHLFCWQQSNACLQIDLRTRTQTRQTMQGIDTIWIGGYMNRTVSVGSHSVLFIGPYNSILKSTVGTPWIEVISHWQRYDKPMGELGTNYRGEITLACGNGIVYTSSTNGRTWKPERSNSYRERSANLNKVKFLTTGVLGHFDDDKISWLFLENDSSAWTGVEANDFDVSENGVVIVDSTGVKLFDLNMNVVAEMRIALRYGQIPMVRFLGEKIVVASAERYDSIYCRNEVWNPYLLMVDLIANTVDKRYIKGNNFGTMYTYNGEVFVTTWFFDGDCKRVSSVSAMNEQGDVRLVADTLDNGYLFGACHFGNKIYLGGSNGIVAINVKTNFTEQVWQPNSEAVTTIVSMYPLNRDTLLVVSAAPIRFADIAEVAFVSTDTTDEDPNPPEPPCSGSGSYTTTLYPVPTTHMLNFTVRWNSPADVSAYVKIYAVDGRLVLEESSISRTTECETTHSVDVSGLAIGAYHIQITTPSETIFGYFIKR